MERWTSYALHFVPNHLKKIVLKNEWGTQFGHPLPLNKDTLIKLWVSQNDI